MVRSDEAAARERFIHAKQGKESRNRVRRQRAVREGAYRARSSAIAAFDAFKRPSSSRTRSIRPAAYKGSRHVLPSCAAASASEKPRWTTTRINRAVVFATSVLVLVCLRVALCHHRGTVARTLDTSRYASRAEVLGRFPVDTRRCRNTSAGHPSPTTRPPRSSRRLRISHPPPRAPHRALDSPLPVRTRGFPTPTREVR